MGRLGPLVLMLTLTLAGCAAPTGADEDAALAPTEDAAEDAPMNLWLLDGPRPFTAKVSNGAEPLMLASRDGSTLFISDWTGLYKSTDGGVSWDATPNPFLEAFNVLADGWALAESEGTLYAADTNGPIVGVAASTDGGETWSVQSKVVEVGAVVDRPWLAARNGDEVTLISNTIRGGVVATQREECVRSTDGGLTWTDRAVASAGVPNAGNVVYDSKGNIWYTNGETLYRQKPCLSAPFPIDLPDSGAQILTQLAVDGDNRVYIALPTPGNTGMSIVGYAPGVPGFRTLVVSPPDLRSNTFGALDVQGDQIAVAWYGSEAAGNPSQGSFDGAWNVFVTRLTTDAFWSGAAATQHDRITTEPNHVGAFCMGGIGCGAGQDRDLLDYFGVDFGPDGTLHVAYGHDGAGSAAEVRYARLAP